MKMALSTHMKKYKEHRRSSAVTDFKHESYHIILGKPNVESPDDLFKHIKCFMIVGRILAVLPYSGIFKKSYTQLYFSPRTPAAITSIIVLTLLSINVLLGFIDTIRRPKTNAYEIATSVGGTIQYCWSWIVYVNFLVRGKKFLALFHCWAKTPIFYGTEDRHLKRDSIFITALILTSAILENAVLHLEYFSSLDDISGYRFGNTTTGMSLMETYFHRSHEYWALTLPYHWSFAIIAFFQHKFMLYVINYLDIMLAVFARAIYFKFHSLNQLANEQLANPLRKGINLSKGSLTLDRHGWNQLAYDHKKVCDLLQQVSDYFSPLIFGSYAVNIYYICMQLLEGITASLNSHSVIHGIYAPWSFLHIIMRMYIVSICAAKINSAAHQIGNVIQDCPVDCYTAEISRLDKKVTTGPPIGLTGLNCFTIQNKFLLKIISVVFTFEIVLLQGKPSTSASIPC